MRTVVVGELGDHAAAWDRLVEDMPLPSPFLRSWWLANVAVGDPLFVLVIEGERLLGGLALQRSTRAGVEWLEFLGSGPLQPDHLDLVSEGASLSIVGEAVRTWLDRRGDRVIDLVGARSAAWVLDVVPGRGEVTPIGVAPYASLPATAEEYLASRTGAMRSTITRTSKRLGKLGVTVRADTPESLDESLDASLDALRELHDRRWGGESGFLDCWEQFSAAARAGVDRGEMRFSELVDASGETIAIEVDFVVGGRTSFYQAGRRTDHELRGSGSMLRYEIVSRAIGRGDREFDLLRGAESYKADWASGRRGLVRIRRGVGPRGMAIVAAARLNATVQRWRHERRTTVTSTDPGDGRVVERAPGASARILFYSDAAQIGGAESVAKNLLRELDGRFSVTVVGTTADVVSEIASVRPNAATVVLPPIDNRWDLAAMVAHRRAIRSIAPDVFHANLAEGSSCQYALVAALSVPGVRIVVTENSPMGVRSKLSRWIKRRSAPRFDAHVAVGIAAARMVEADVGLTAGSVETVVNGVPRIVHQPQRRRLDAPVVGAVSRFDPVKGLDVLIAAVARLEGVHLEIIGDGSERAALERLIDELGVSDRVHLVGWMPGARHELVNFDVVVLPSRLEGMPMVLIEAMQAGTATIATDVGSVREVVEDGVSGRVVPPDDVDALADAIGELLADDDVRSRIALAGRDVALERFSSGANVAAYEGVYDRVLSRPARRGLRPG